MISDTVRRGVLFRALRCLPTCRRSDEVRSTSAAHSPTTVRLTSTCCPAQSPPIRNPRPKFRRIDARAARVLSLLTGPPAVRQSSQDIAFGTSNGTIIAGRTRTSLLSRGHRRPPVWGSAPSRRWPCALPAGGLESPGIVVGSSNALILSREPAARLLPLPYRGTTPGRSVSCAGELWPDASYIGLCMAYLERGR